MIVVNTVEMLPADNLARIELSNGKRYKILLKDYENLPFECKSDSLLENIIIDVEKINSGGTNRYFGDFDGDCAAFLGFLSKKYIIYSSALSKVALSDVPKRQLYQKLYFAVLQNNKNNKSDKKNKTEKTETDKETLKILCGLVCDEFEAAGYINDRRYAADKAKYLKEYKKYGNGRIKEYLYQKGIASEIINEILEDEFFEDEDGDFENMRNLLKKKYGEDAGRLDKTDRNAIQKAIHMLVRNGYKYQQAKTAAADFTGGAGTEYAENDNNEENEEYEDFENE